MKAKKISGNIATGFSNLLNFEFPDNLNMVQKSLIFYFGMHSLAGYTFKLGNKNQFKIKQNK